uniref:Cytochrome P450 n=1 Tax=Psilocybe cubensis TaxID=181762 RepID=A0A8H7XX85_PSICU
MVQFDTLAILIALGSLGLIYYRKSKKGPYSHLPLPPGPPRKPIVGNLFNMPSRPEWQDYHKISQEHNTDIIYLNVVGTNIVVLDTHDAAMELLERRSSKYSSRAHLPMVNELMGWDFAVGFKEYGQQWRDCRRLMHHSFHPGAVVLFRPHMLRATRNLLKRFLDYPENIMGNIRHMSGEGILSITYGLDVLADNDPYIKVAEQSLAGFAEAAVPGAFLVDSFSLLKYVPEWFPGAGFQTKARIWRDAAFEMRDYTFKGAKKNVLAGTSPHCFVSANLNDMDPSKPDPVKEQLVKDTAGSMYSAGTDTTLSAVGSCILAFLEYPETLKKAQAELDRVIKPGHLPDFNDYDSLPYITALTMETLRWRDVGPIGLPHVLIEEDEYKGYRIPAGTIVIANSWAMLHNEETYKDPFTFNPDRFLTKDGKLDKTARDPGHACWGFGRRVCPGRYLAFSGVWITLASLAAVFDITKAVDEKGNIIEPSHEYVNSAIIVPKPFQASVRPRSRGHEQVIRDAVAAPAA